MILREASRSISTRGSRFRVAVFWPWQSMQGKRGPSTPRGAPPTGISCPQALVERRHTGTGRHTVCRGQRGSYMQWPTRAYVLLNVCRGQRGRSLLVAAVTTAKAHEMLPSLSNTRLENAEGDPSTDARTRSLTCAHCAHGFHTDDA